MKLSRKVSLFFIPALLLLADLRQEGRAQGMHCGAPPPHCVSFHTYPPPPVCTPYYHWESVWIPDHYVWDSRCHRYVWINGRWEWVKVFRETCR